MFKFGTVTITGTGLKPHFTLLPGCKSQTVCVDAVLQHVKDNWQTTRACQCHRVNWTIACMHTRTTEQQWNFTNGCTCDFETDEKVRYRGTTGRLVAAERRDGRPGRPATRMKGPRYCSASPLVQNFVFYYSSFELNALRDTQPVEADSCNMYQIVTTNTQTKRRSQ